MHDSPKIYSYSDYRQFLADYYKYKKSTTKTFSYRAFAKQCGFKSPNFIKLVMDGQRNLTNDSIDRLTKAMQLQAKEAEFFRCLVQFNQEKQDDKKKNWYDKLQALTPYSLKRDLESESIEYLSHWIYPVIREMAVQDDFRDDPYWISRRLTGRANLKEISKALDFLIKNGFIEKDDSGRFSCPDKFVLSSDEIRSLAIRRYHRRILAQSQESIEDLDINQREFGAAIFSLPKSRVIELKQKLKDFRDEISEWAIEQQDSEEAQVIQMNFQMFPQTKG